jgi:fibro-slime domain-containing protein
MSRGKKNHTNASKASRRVSRQAASSVWRRRVVKISKIVCAVTFGLLVLTSLTSIVRGINTIPIEQTNGVPEQWTNHLGGGIKEALDEIVVPVTYWDQRADKPGTGANKDVNRQFEWWAYGNYPDSNGVQTGLVRERLGSDGKPVPAYNSLEETAHMAVANRGIYGSNFNRWFNQVPDKSLEIQGQVITFTRLADGRYQYGGPNKNGRNVFPLDNVPAAKAFSAGDPAPSGHNFGFTMQMETEFYVKADGTEIFDFQGDDDVWVFVNGRLILDIGGLHEAIDGSFQILEPDSAGNINIVATVGGKSRTVAGVGLAQGEVATLSFFYAERSTTEANCLITLSHFDWPVLARPTLAGSYDAEEDTMEWTATVANRDTKYEMTVDGLAVWLNDGAAYSERADNAGFLPFDENNIYYTTTPNVASSWEKLKISEPSNAGFLIDEEIVLAPSGQAGDTLYVRYNVKPTEKKGRVYNKITFATETEGVEMAVSASAAVAYEKPTKADPEPELEPEPEPTPGGGGTVTYPSHPNHPTYPNLIVDEDWDAEAPLPMEETGGTNGVYNGPSFLAPNTGVGSFADVVLSQWFVMGQLAVFAVSFCAWQVLYVKK